MNKNPKHVQVMCHIAMNNPDKAHLHDLCLVKTGGWIGNHNCECPCHLEYTCGIKNERDAYMRIGYDFTSNMGIAQLPFQDRVALLQEAFAVYGIEITPTQARKITDETDMMRSRREWSAYRFLDNIGVDDQEAYKKPIVNEAEARTNAVKDKEAAEIWDGFAKSAEKG